MILEMREIVEAQAARNDLESYILQMRSGVAEGGRLCSHIRAAERSVLSTQLERAEDWLYDHLDDGKQVFEEKLAELRVLGDPVERRFKEECRRGELSRALEEAVASYKASSQRARHKLVDRDRLRGLERACDDAVAWLADMTTRQARLPKCEEPLLDCASIEARTEELARLADAVLEGRQDSNTDVMGSPDMHEEEFIEKRTLSEGRPTAMDVD